MNNLDNFSSAWCRALLVSLLREVPHLQYARGVQVHRVSIMRLWHSEQKKGLRQRLKKKYCRSLNAFLRHPSPERVVAADTIFTAICTWV